jgi:hypothetical protein
VRSGHKWKDNIKLDLKEQNVILRTEWPALENTTTNINISWSLENFLTI